MTSSDNTVRSLLLSKGFIEKGFRFGRKDEKTIPGRIAFTGTGSTGKILIGLVLVT